MEYGQLKRALEGVLFAAGEPVTAQRLCLGLETDRTTLDQAARELAEEYEREKRGVRLLRLEHSYQLCSAPEQAAIIRRTLESRKPPKLSQPALEVLAVVAYNQPVTKAFVEQVRGVDCSAVMQGLVAKGLVEEKGRLELPGRPLLYGTTPHFLLSFGLTTLEDLPPLPEKEDALAQDEAPDADDADTEESAAQAEEQPVPPEEETP